MQNRRRRSARLSNRATVIVVIVLAFILGMGLFMLLRSRTPDTPPEERRDPVATITMSDGAQMRVTLYPDDAPETVNNFIALANSGFYDSLEFYRVVAGVFIQGGDPNNNGTGDPGYAIRGEFEENGVTNPVSHMRGAISMARQSGYDTAGSQFFIMQGSYPEYDGRYAAFGKIEDDDSLAVLDAIASQPTDSNYVPLTRQVISSIRVETYGAEYDAPEKLDRP